MQFGLISEQDFYNLVDVYLDAVFYPKCVNEIQTFQQEGWHYELNDPAEDITYKGRSLWETCTFFREHLVPINSFLLLSGIWLGKECLFCVKDNFLCFSVGQQSTV